MAEPLSVRDVKSQLRIDGNDEDLFLEGAIVDARGWVEDYTGIILTRRQITKSLRRFDQSIVAWPIISIDSVSYVSQTGEAVLLDATLYQAQMASRPARLTSRSWPVTMKSSGIAVTMTAGFGSIAAINDFSPNLINAMRRLVAGAYENRETGGIGGEPEEAAKSLCQNLRARRV